MSFSELDLQHLQRDDHPPTSAHLQTFTASTLKGERGESRKRKQQFEPLLCSVEPENDAVGETLSTRIISHRWKMTRGFLSALIMRPHICCSVLHVSMLVVLFTFNADGVDPECETIIKVRRHTVYKAFVQEKLRIKCTVQFCDNNTLPVSWNIIKNNTMFVPVNESSRIQIEWKQLKGSEGTSYLIFSKTLSSDSGLYHCQCGNVVSHNINVSIHVDHHVKDDETTTVASKIEPSTTSPTADDDGLMLYVYCGASITGFVLVVVLISVVSMQGCKGKTKKETENQYMSVPMDQLHPHTGSSAAPAQRSTRSTPPQSNASTSPRDNEHLYSQINNNRDRQRDREEDDGSSVVYAALNHQLPAPAAAARPRRSQDDFSEYAAIRVS